MVNANDRSSSFFSPIFVVRFVIFSEFLFGSLGLPCRFSQEWRGRYYQSGLGEIIIRDNIITTKGKCIEYDRDYYLFDNREQNCFHCLLLLRQHKNLIQYKESFCTSPASLKMVCGQIRVETPLYTLVREPSVPIRCPFQEAYHFKYNDLSHGFCDADASFAQPCASPSKYRLQFKHCEAAALYNGKELDFECLASWKDGSETYLYSRLTGMDSDAKDDRYRCFKYHQYGNEVSLAMSADATCRGLRTAKDGPFLLEFTEDNSGWPPPSCHFPDWLMGVTWRDLAGRFRYIVDESGERLFGSLRDVSKEQVSNQFRCRHITPSSRLPPGDDEYIIHTFVTHNCVSSYQCLKLKRLANHVIELHLGIAGQVNGQVYCQTEVYHNVQVLTSDGSGPLATVACPRPGMHHTAPSDGCIYRLNVGCRSESSIEIDHSCSPGRPGISLDCLVTWTEGHRSFVIVKQKQADVLNCYSFREESGATVFGIDDSCNRNVTPLIGGQHNHLYSSLRHENCRREVRTTTVNRRLAQHKSTTKTTATINNDWPFPNRNYHNQDFSIRHSHSGDYEDDDDDDDDDGYSEMDYDNASSGTEENLRSDDRARTQGVPDAGLGQVKGGLQTEWVTIQDRHPLSTPNKVLSIDKEETLKRRPVQGDEKTSATKSPDPLTGRNVDVKGRKQHIATTKPHSMHARNRSTSRFLFLPPSSYRLLITTSLMITILHFL